MSSCDFYVVGHFYYRVCLTGRTRQGVPHVETMEYLGRRDCRAGIKPEEGGFYVFRLAEPQPYDPSRNDIPHAVLVPTFEQARLTYLSWGEFLAEIADRGLNQSEYTNA